MQKFRFSTCLDFIIVHAINFAKNYLFYRYFAKILTRITKQLFRRTLHDDYSENQNMQ